jgi:hypothetical protein
LTGAEKESLGIALIPSTNTSVPELANQQLNSYNELYQDFQLIESKSTTFMGNQAYMLQYTYTDKLFGRVRAMDLGFISGGNDFIISYFGDPSKFYNYILTIHRMTDSFQVLSTLSRLPGSSTSAAVNSGVKLRR